MAKIQGNKKACLITPGHIAADPRLVKEAQALSQAGMQVHIIFTQYVDYLIDHERQILSASPNWTFKCLDWSGKSLTSKIFRAIGGLLRRFIPGINTKINRNFAWQLKQAIAYPADIYIGHNPGGLPVAVIAAKKNNAKCGFDAEDFHRNERCDDEKDPDVVLKTAIENKYIRQLDYMVAASPQIAAKYVDLFHINVEPVLNVFPKTAVSKIINNTDRPLQLFWFSQTVGLNRGLETIIRAINKTGVKMDLHLLGKVAPAYKNQLQVVNGEKASAVLHFHAPVVPDEIFVIAKQFDIGLALESSIPLNRDICLTNKIFTFIQSGLAVIASNTTAQTILMEQYAETGKLYKNINELAEILLSYHHNRGLLYQTKQASYRIGQTKLNWEIESEKLINVVQKTLANQ